MIVIALGWTGTAAASTPTSGETEPADPNEIALTWVDTSHSYATSQALALAQWLDDFFGDPEYDSDRAESYLRLQFISKWDEEEDDDVLRARLHGRIQLPKLSKRVSLVFSGEDGDELTDDELNKEDAVGLRVEVAESLRSRLDATLGLTSNGLRPGVRFRFQDAISERNSYRYTQRLQWDIDKNLYTTGQVDLNHHINDNNNLRWSNRVVYGEETDGVEWRTRLAWRQRRDSDRKRPYAMSYFGSINGITDPSSLVKNYQVGVEFRRRVYRDFLFFEVEPSWNYRRPNEEESRSGAWAVVLRLEVALQRDLMRVRGNRGD